MMNKAQAMMVMTGIFGAAGMAQASIAITEDPGIVAPCDDSYAEVFWLGSDAGYTGELSWINPLESGSDVVLWNNHAASIGQSFVLPMTFAAGERLDFQYEIIAGGLDVFSTANENDWGQFSVDASNPYDVLVGIEDIRLPGGDSDFNDAEFNVVFTCGSVVPAPGSLAVLGAGGMLGLRRRR